jgi:hypothetical protein
MDVPALPGQGLIPVRTANLDYQILIGFAELTDKSTGGRHFLSGTKDKNCWLDTFLC